MSYPSFHLSLTVLVHYRTQRVFSLGEWPPQIPADYSTVLGISSEVFLVSHTRLSLSVVAHSGAFCYRKHSLLTSRNPPDLHRKFRLFRFHSPLLTESPRLGSRLAETDMISFPPATWMFLFTGYPRTASQ